MTLPPTLRGLLVALLLTPGVALAQAAPAPAPAPASTPAVLAADQMQWDQSPSGSDLASLFPAGALEANKGGTASILCSVVDDGSLANCTVQSETPAGLGFGAASILAAKLFKLHMTPQVSAALKATGATVVIPIDWASPLA